MKWLRNILGKSVNEEQLIEEIHNEFDTAPQRLLDEALAIIETNTVKVTLESEIENKANRLEKIGFVSNALVHKKNEINKRNEEKLNIIKLTQDEANLIKYYSETYPFLKFLTESELDRICDKYGLVYAPVGNYRMPVPDKNLSEIETAQPLKNNDKEKIRVHVRIHRNNQWEFNLPNNLSKILHEGFIVDEWNFLPTSLGDARLIELAKKYGGYSGDYSGYVTKPYVKAECSMINRDGLFIAAPKKHFNLNGLTFDNKKGFFSVTKTMVKSDPIVFRYVKGGIQVISKWGLEANDPALQVEILN